MILSLFRDKVFRAYACGTLAIMFLAWLVLP